MPQLDTSTFSAQLFWLGFSFVLLYFILSYLALPKIAQVYAGRQKTVEEKLSDANIYREQAEQLLAEYEATIASARAEAHERYRSITHAVTAEVLTKQHTFLEALQSRLHLEEQKLYQESLDMRKDIQKATAEVAVVLLKKITGHPYTPKDLAAFQEKA